MRRARIIVALMLMGAAAGAPAQSFSQEWQRWRVAGVECGERLRAQTERNCGEQCRRAAERRHAQCLGAAERRYEQALGRVMRSRR